MKRIITAGDIVEFENIEYKVDLIAGITAKLLGDKEPIYTKISNLSFIRITKLSPAEKLQAILEVDLLNIGEYIPKKEDLITLRSFQFDDVYRIISITLEDYCNLQHVNDSKKCLVKHTSDFDKDCLTELIPIPTTILYQGI